MHKNRYPLSHNQKALYLHTLRFPTDTSFNIPLLLKIEGKVDPDVLLESINDLFNLYPVLRLNIVESPNGEPENVIPFPDFGSHSQKMQSITLHTPVLEQINLPTDQDLYPFLFKKLHTAFKLDQDLLIRFYYIICNNGDNYLYIVYHHILTDDLPQSFILDLKYAYKCRNLGEMPQQFPVNTSYDDFVAWEKEYIKSTDAQADREYWQQYYDKYNDGVFQLNSLSTQAKQQTYTAYKVILPITLKTKLVEASQKNAVSLFAVYITAFFLLLKKLPTQKDKNIAIATIINNRFNRQFYKLLGDFTNTVILHEEISGQVTNAALKKVFTSIVSAIKHSKLSYYEIIKGLKTQPLVSASIVYHHNKQISNQNEDALRLRIVHEICQLPRENFNLEVIDDHQQPVLFFKYNYNIFSEPEVAHLAEEYLDMLEQITGPDLVNINDIRFQRFLHKQTNKMAAKEYPCIHQVFEKIADEFPNLIAIRYGEQEISYQLLNNRANQLANLIKSTYQEHYKKPLVNEIVIGIYLPKSIDAIVAMLAILKTGSCYLPLDVNYPNERILSLINKVQASLIITKNNLLNFSQELVLLDIEYKNLSTLSYKNIDDIFPPTNLAYIIFTSGTTGEPNGVAIEHTGVVNLALTQGSYFEIEQNSKVIQFSSLAFDASTSEIWCTLLRKGTLCIPNSTNKLIGSDLSDYLNNEKIDVATIPPSILATVAAENIHLKILILAGETPNPTLITKWQKHTRVINAYGPTETTVCATMHEYKHGDLNTNIGKPLKGVLVYLFDEYLHPVPPGTDGEIYIGGLGVARGYYHNESLTHKKFISCSSMPHVGVLYKTGDRGRYLPDESIEYRGRTDTQIKIRGFRIEIEEIENIINKFIEVKRAIIAADTSGDEIRLIAFILPNSADFSMEKVRKQLSSLVPGYMLPNDYCQIETIPLTSNDKIDRKKLLTLVNQTSVLTQSIQNNSLDDNFLNLCAEILKIEKGKIDLSFSFFDLGGTSLTVLKLITQIKKIFGLEISIASVFNAQSMQLLLDNVKAKLNVEVEENDMITDLKIKINSSINKTGYQSILSYHKAVLLTGATGFLGAHLLINLLKLTDWTIFCLIRARYEDEAKFKLRSTLKKFEIENVDESRIQILIGDLSKSKLGLSDKALNLMFDNIDSIFHCGADVNHIYPYKILRTVNVLSTAELLKIAEKNRTRIHYISTIDTVTSGPETFDSEENPLEQCTPNWGYIQSKWVSEKIISQSNIPFTIYRPGNITGHSLTGVSSPQKNHASILLKFCIETGFAPEWDVALEMTPVDCLSEIIIKLAIRENQSQRQFYNLHNPTTIKWKDYINLINENGYRIHFLSEDLWINNILVTLDNSHPLSVFKGLYQGKELSKLVLSPHVIKNIKTAEALKAINRDDRIDYKSLIHSYLNYFKNISFIN